MDAVAFEVFFTDIGVGDVFVIHVVRAFLVGTAFAGNGQRFDVAAFGYFGGRVVGGIGGQGNEDACEADGEDFRP